MSDLVTNVTNAAAALAAAIDEAVAGGYRVDFPRHALDVVAISATAAVQDEPEEELPAP